jgi:hypothetical protein
MLVTVLGPSQLASSISPDSQQTVQLTSREQVAVDAHAAKQEGQALGGRTRACANKGLGSKRISEGTTEYFLFVLCEAYLLHPCSSGGEWLGAARALFQNGQLTTLSIDEAPYDPPYYKWVQKHFPSRLWQRANNPTGRDYKTLTTELSRPKGC